MHAIIGIGGIALCDGGKDDRYWLERLIAASDLDIGFSLSSWDLLVNNLSDIQIRRYCDFAAKIGDDVPHRAGPDALLNMRAFAYAIGIEDLDEIPHDFSGI